MFSAGIVSARSGVLHDTFILEVSFPTVELLSVEQDYSFLLPVKLFQVYMEIESKCFLLVIFYKTLNTFNRNILLEE